MKTASFCRILSTAFFAVLFLFAATAKGIASGGDNIDEGLTAAKGWIAQIDAAQYDESYDFGCSAMHDKVPQHQWDTILSALRKPWGAVLTRQQVSHVYKPNGYEDANGEFLVITYDTTFEHLNPATEVVVLKWEDGKWRGAGYNAGPKDTGEATAPVQSNSSTETHTEEHVRPEPGQ